MCLDTVPVTSDVGLNVQCFFKVDGYVSNLSKKTSSAVVYLSLDHRSRNGEVDIKT